MKNILKLLIVVMMACSYPVSAMQENQQTSAVYAPRTGVEMLVTAQKTKTKKNLYAQLIKSPQKRIFKFLKKVRAKAAASPRATKLIVGGGTALAVILSSVWVYKNKFQSKKQELDEAKKEKTSKKAKVRTETDKKKSIRKKEENKNTKKEDKKETKKKEKVTFVPETKFNDSTEREAEALKAKKHDEPTIAPEEIVDKALAGAPIEEPAVSEVPVPVRPTVEAPVVEPAPEGPASINDEVVVVEETKAEEYADNGIDESDHAILGLVEASANGISRLVQASKAKVGSLLAYFKRSPELQGVKLDQVPAPAPAPDLAPDLVVPK